MKYIIHSQYIQALPPDLYCTVYQTVIKTGHRKPLHYNKDVLLSFKIFVPGKASEEGYEMIGMPDEVL